MNCRKNLLKYLRELSSSREEAEAPKIFISQIPEYASVAAMGVRISFVCMD